MATSTSRDSSAATLVTSTGQEPSNNLAAFNMKDAATPNAPVRAAQAANTKPAATTRPAVRSAPDSVAAQALTTEVTPSIAAAATTSIEDLLKKNIDDKVTFYGYNKVAKGPQPYKHKLPLHLAQNYFEKLGPKKGENIVREDISNEEFDEVFDWVVRHYCFGSKVFKSQDWILAHMGLEIVKIWETCVKLGTRSLRDDLGRNITTAVIERTPAKDLVPMMQEAMRTKNHRIENAINKAAPVCCRRFDFATRLQIWDDTYNAHLNGFAQTAVNAVAEYVKSNRMTVLDCEKLYGPTRGHHAACYPENYEQALEQLSDHVGQATRSRPAQATIQEGAPGHLRSMAGS